MAKRAIDIILAFILITLLFPAFAVIASAILLESQGDVFVGKPRIGVDGKIFHLLNFRTFVSEGKPKNSHFNQHPLRTRVGGILHAASLEGMPQLFNILLGDMSFVGPRLQSPGTIPESLKRVKDYDLCKTVRPGLTGLAQINGYSRELVRVEDLFSSLYYDIEYVKNWNLRLDVITMLRALTHILVKH